MTIRASFLSGVALAVIAGAGMTASHSVFADDGGAPIILAQAEGGNPFWNKLFNRPDNKSGSDAPKPIFLDRRTTHKPSEKTVSEPYDMSRSYASRSEPSEAHMDRKKAEIIAENRLRLQPLLEDVDRMTAQTMAVVDENTRRREAAAMEAMRQALNRTGDRSQGNASSQDVQYQYNPGQVWSNYSGRNTRAEDGAPTLYNSR